MDSIYNGLTFSQIMNGGRRFDGGGTAESVGAKGNVKANALGSMASTGISIGADVAVKGLTSLAQKSHGGLAGDSEKIYGRIDDDPLSRLFSMGRDRAEAVENASNLADQSIGVATSSDDLARRLSSLNYGTEMKKEGFGAGVADNLSAFAQGAKYGTMIGGPGMGTLIGGIVGGVANLGSLFGRKRARNRYNEEIRKSNAQLVQNAKFASENYNTMSSINDMEDYYERI